MADEVPMPGWAPRTEDEREDPTVAFRRVAAELLGQDRLSVDDVEQLVLRKTVHDVAIGNIDVDESSKLLGSLARLKSVDKADDDSGPALTVEGVRDMLHGQIALHAHRKVTGEEG